MTKEQRKEIVYKKYQEVLEPAEKKFLEVIERVGIPLSIVVIMTISFIALSVANTNGFTIISTSVLDEVCMKLYGNETIAYVPNVIEPEDILRCVNTIKKIDVPESKIMLVKGE